MNPALETPPCPLTGKPHRLVTVAGHVQCEDCQQQIEGCCEGTPPGVQ